jgi:hypothetical protein
MMECKSIEAGKMAKCFMENKIKAKELRIGNLVNFDDTLLKFEFESGWNLDYIKPIPLTDEWLTKLGFESDGIEWFDGVICLGIFKDGIYYLPTEEIHYRVGQEFKYVHQLQNLIFAITGEDYPFEL